MSKHCIERTVGTLPHRWAMWLAVDGDLRFLSHHDMLRTMERLLIRAGLSLRYTQGFNPRPVLSLAFPRPVGVESREDLLVLALDAPIEADALLQAVNTQCPKGLHFFRALPLEGKVKPQALDCQYEMVVEDNRIADLEQRLLQWQQAQQWPLVRQKPSKRPQGKPKTKSIDMKELVVDLQLSGNTLRWRQVPQDATWARPGEVLEMLGFDPRQGLSLIVRTHVHYGGM